MHNPFRQQESDTTPPRDFLAIFHWLINLVLLTEQEQDDAGIYIGNRRIIKSYKEKENPND